jgi:transposase
MSFIRKIKRGNKTYLAEVENKWIDGKSVQKHIRYIGTEANGETKLAASISDIEVEDVKVFGPLIVLHHISKQIGLPELLGEYASEILSLVYAHCLNYQSVNRMSSWFKRTDLSTLLDIENITEKTLLNALDSLEGIDTEQLQLKIFNTLDKKFHVTRNSLVYDVTNTYLYGKKCPMAKVGHDKEGVKGRPLIQIALAVTQEKGLPIFHKVFDGNIHDARTLQDVATTMKKYKIKSGLIIYDRGITSSENIDVFHDLHWDTLCGVPIRDKLKKKLLPIIKKDFTSIDNLVQCNKTVFYVKTMPYKIGSVKGTLAICFNKRKEGDFQESRHCEIKYAEKLLRLGKKIKPGLGIYFNRRGEIIHNVIKENELFDGYSCMFTTKNISKEEMVRLYFDKDVVEKAFRCIKGITQLRPIRHWLYDRVVAHVMICYLSYTLLIVLKEHLKKLNLSPEKALQQLDTMYKVYMRDKRKKFKISRIVTLNKIQKDILRAVDKKLLNPGV